jgi:hypothetical protein
VIVQKSCKTYGNEIRLQNCDTQVAINVIMFKYTCKKPGPYLSARACASSLVDVFCEGKGCLGATIEILLGVCFNILVQLYYKLFLLDVIIYCKHS